MGIFNIIIILQKFQMQSGKPNHYPKFSKLHQFVYTIEAHHQNKSKSDQRNTVDPECQVLELTKNHH